MPAVGIAAPILLVVLRLVQGLALGGEYGGAATYVAEHAPEGRRGFYTSWIQTTATLGLFAALLVVIGTRTMLGEAAFQEWGWRIPFLLSMILLGISLWIRLQLAESPAFVRMKEEGTRSKAPIREAFGQWPNARIVLIALFGAVAGQAVVWYAGQFYALVLPRTRAQGRSGGGEHHDRDRPGPGDALLRPLRLAVRPHRPQADHHGRAAARRGDLFPLVQGADLGRQSGAGRRRR